jgi:hypothetical protein
MKGVKTRWYNKGGLFRVVLSSGRIIESPPTIRIPVGAKRWAFTWAADVGVSGTIRLEAKNGDAWTILGIVHVKDSEAGRWEEA